MFVSNTSALTGAQAGGGFREPGTAVRFFDPLAPSSYDLLVADPPWAFQTRSQAGEAKSASRTERNTILIPGSGQIGARSAHPFPFSAREIAAVMGGDVTSRDSCNVPGPGHSRKDRSLAIRITPSGFLVHSFANDDWKDCRDYVRGKLGLDDDWQSDKTPAPDMTGDDLERRKKFALKIWADCIDPRATLAERYLREHRGLDLPDSTAYSVIRFHAGLRYEMGKYLPAMVCLLRDIVTGEPCGIHRTFLDRYTGNKIDRKMLGIAKDAAIKLDAEPSSALTIGEGVETVLAARTAGFAPTWALGSSGAVRAFPMLQNLGELTILQENDPTSRRDVKTCARRYLGARRPVNIVEPKVGNDFNDCWKARGDE